MESENSGTPRLTRARGRGLSENRPMTPVLNVAVDCGSPRQTRRSRINSTKLEMMTPIRTTRGSVARGETPEPVTEPLIFRGVGRRTPSKSAQRLAFPDEVHEEQPQTSDRQVEEKDESRPMTPILDVPVDSGSALQTPGSRMNSTISEMRTPTPTTRASVARGETPEHMTPSKSINKQLNLPEKQNEKQPQTSEQEDEKKDESRSMTPALDVPVDRKSPRRTLRSRINSTTSEMRTPIRTTRGSVARGKTPEPVKEPLIFRGVGRRTPSKSAQRLTFPDEVHEEQPQTSDRQVEKKDESRPMTPILDVPVDSGSALQMPGSRINSTRAESGTPIPTARESMDRGETSEPVIPPLNFTGVGRRTPSKSVQQLNFPDEGQPHASERMNEENKLAAVADTVVMENNAPSVKRTISLKNDVENSREESTKQKQIEHRSKILESIINKSFHVEGSAKTASMDAEQLIGRVSKVKVKVKDVLAPEKHFVKMVARELKPSGNNESIEGNHEKHSEVKDILKHSDNSTDMQITEDVQEVIHSECITPNVKTPLKSTKCVRFPNNDLSDLMKTKYQKTPSRIRSAAHELITIDTCIQGPSLNEKFVIGRCSSTPLAKVELTTSHAKEASEESKPPVQIDTIKPISLIEKTDPIPLPVEKTNEQPYCPVSDDEIEEDYERDQADSVCEFLDNEVNVVNNYQSGDSMDSDLRREIEENEIPDNGESVGSQETVDNSEDSADEKMSFIVSDNDLDDNNIESLYFSSESDTKTTDKDVRKQRRRIIVHDSSDENDQIEGTKESNKETVEDPEISAIQKMNELLQKNAVDMSICEVLEEKNSRKLDRLNETVEEIVISSSNENEEEKNKNSSGNRKNIYEVIDESDDEHVDLTELTKNGPDSISQEEHPGKPLNENNLISCDSPMAGGSATQCNAANKDSSPKLTVEASSPSSGSLKCHAKQKRDKEPVLLDEISTCDLSHMRQMFNPLQKTRRQTLYGQDLKTREQQPRLKLKRRSEQFGSDVKPSQSFIEFLADEPKAKRKRLSKSFCGTVDGLDTSMEVEVQAQAETSSNINCSKSEVSDNAMDEAVESVPPVPSAEAELSEGTVVFVKSEASLKVVETSGAGESEEVLSPVEIVETAKEGSPYFTDPDKKQDNEKSVDPVEEVKVKNDTVRSSHVHLSDQKLTASNPMAQQAAPEKDFGSDSSIDNVSQEKLSLAHVRKTDSEEEEDEGKLKSHDKYLEYSDNLIQAANEAKLNQKMQRIGAGKVQQDCLNLKKSTPDRADAAFSLKVKKPPTVKKNVKRLQATKQAVRHAIQLLTPDAVNSEAQSLARKLSLKPKSNTKSTTANIQKRKQHRLLMQESPVKSSDEENHREPKRIKNSAGFVTVVSDTKPKLIKKFKTSSSIVEVEPCTPTQKYFREIPQSPINHGFEEFPANPKHKKKPSSVRNPATESALRFKRQVFGKFSK